MSSEVDNDEEIAVSADGVTVRKAFEPEEFPVPAIRFAIESEADEPVSIRLAEPIPEDFPMDGVGFHPDYDSDNWTAYEDHHVEYSRRLEPGEEITTVYGIRIESEEEAAQFLTEPELQSVGEPGREASDDEVEGATIDDIADREGDRAVKDMIAGESDSIPGLDDDDGEEPVDASPDADEGIDLDLEDADVERQPVENDEDDEDAPDIDFGDRSVPDEGTDREDDPEIDLDLGDEEASDEGDEPEIELDVPDPEDAQEPDEAGDVAASGTDDSGVEADAGPTDSDDGAAVDAEPATDDEATPDAVKEGEPTDAIDEGGPAEAVGTADEEEPADSITEDGPASPGEGTASAEGSTGTDSVAAALAEELRAGDVDERDKEVLREELDLGPSGVDRARVDHLQSRVEEVAAYTEALEEFLDAEGTAQQLIDDFQAEVEAMRDELAAIDDRVDDQVGTVERHDEAIDAHEDALDEHDETLAEHGDAIDEHDETLAEHDDRLADAEGTVEGLDDDLAEVDEEVEDLATDLDDLAGDLADVTGDVDRLDEEVGSVDADVSDLEEQLADLEATVEDVRSDVEDVEEWRSQLGEMFTE